jgi:hypothetical protein
MEQVSVIIISNHVTYKSRSNSYYSYNMVFHNFAHIERTVYKTEYRVQTISSVLSTTPALYRF